MENTKKIPETVPSKSVQRRIKQQTGVDVPLSPEAAKAHGEPFNGARADAYVNTELADGQDKKGPALSPILKISDEMSEQQIGRIFNTYRAAERTGTEKLIAQVERDLGAKVAAHDKVCKDACKTSRETQERAIRDARRAYEQAIKAAKSAFQSATDKINNAFEAERAAHGENFDKAVAPINAECEAKKKQAVDEFTAKMAAAVAELKPIVEVVRKKAGEAKAQQAVYLAEVEKNKAEREAAETKISADVKGRRILVVDEGQSPAEMAAMSDKLKRMGATEVEIVKQAPVA